MLPQLRVNSALTLPDTEQWQFRFEVYSESSDRTYVIAQHKHKKHWGCSCPGWRAHRTCKHLAAVNLPGKERPHEVEYIKQ